MLGEGRAAFAVIQCRRLQPILVRGGQARDLFLESRGGLAEPLERGVDSRSRVYTGARRRHDVLPRSSSRGVVAAMGVVRRRVAGPALACVVVVVTLAAIELGMRVALSARDTAALAHVGLDAADDARLRWMERAAAHRSGMAFDISDPLLGWRPRAHVDRIRRVDGQRVRVTTDAHGVRGGAGIGEARTPGVPRVAIFGCSQTFGGQVDDDDVYTARVARMLPGTEVLNFGVHGYGTDQMLLRWESEGVRYRPDVVVLAFAYYHVSRNATDFRFFAKPRFVRGADGALALRGVPVPSPDMLRASDPPRPLPGLDALVAARWLWDRELHRREAALYQPASDAWAVTAALVERFARSAEAHGARFLVLDVAEPEPAMDAAAAALAARLGIPWVGSHAQLDAIRAAGLPVLLPSDPHWGPHGHAALAETLRSALCAAPGLTTCGAAQAAVPP